MFGTLLEPTKRSVSPAFRDADAQITVPATSSAPSSNLVVFIDVRSEQPPPAAGYKSARARAADSEAIPERREALERARRRIANDFYDDNRLPLARLRLAKGWSQTRLADELGTTQSHVARMEAGRQDIMLGTVVRLARALEMDADELAAILLRSR